MFRFSKNSHGVREGGGEKQKIYQTSACFHYQHPWWRVGRTTVMVSGRSKCQAPGKSLAEGECTGAGGSQVTKVPGRTMMLCLGKELWGSLRRESSITVPFSCHIPCISRQQPAPSSSVLDSCAQSFSWLDMLLCGQCSSGHLGSGGGFLVRRLFLTPVIR